MQTRFNHLLQKTAFVAAVIAIGAACQPATLRADEHGDRDRDRDNDKHDQIIMTFSTVGDSRQDPVSPDPTTLPLSGQDAHWLQSTRAWTRINRSIENQQASLLFFNGDMIMGYGNAVVPADATTVSNIVNSDLVKFHTQYAFWRGTVASMMEVGTYVIPVPGNHEVQSKPLGKKAQPANEEAWRANMGDLILDNQRFLNLFGEQPTNESTGDNRAMAPGDGKLGAQLPTDQSQLSYSFDLHGYHFVVINTDPVGNDGHAPVNWLAQDLQSAQDRGVRRSFVFGHKPAYTYYYGSFVPAPPALPLPEKAAGLDADPAARDAFWNVIEQYNATYFCGHEHIFNMMQPTASTGGKAWQVLVGSGGSPFEASPTDATVSVTDRYYAWATVNIYQSGKVKITAYGFDDQFGPTKILKSVTLH